MIEDRIDKFMGEARTPYQAFKIKKYPELDRLAKDVADDTLRAINTKTGNVKSEMPYKSQYVLEEVIKILQDRV